MEIPGITHLDAEEVSRWDWPEAWVPIEDARRRYLARKHWQAWLADWEAAGLPEEAGFSVNEHGVVDAGAEWDLDPELLRRLIPWRKGPWNLAGTAIETEWRSEWKWDRIASAVGKLSKHEVADVGGGNGYYGFRLLEAGAGRVTVFDPTEKSFLQAALARRLAGVEDRLALSLGGEEDLDHFHGRFDLILCMGVQYHRRDPWTMMQRLYKALQPGGTLIFETLIWPGDESVGFMPPDRYCGMRNVWLLPTLAGIEAFASRGDSSRRNFCIRGRRRPMSSG